MAKGGPRAGAGRPKGVKNKVTRDIKEAVLQAFEEGGGKGWLMQQMIENPTAFMTLIGKIIPTQVQAEMTGKDGGPVQTITVNPSELSSATLTELMRAKGMGKGGDGAGD